jgi:hypothetical protein
MAHDVYISHCANDKTTADALCAALESEGIRCWIAPRDILPGANWGQSILEAIEQARIFVLIFSAAAYDSLQVRREVEHALSHAVDVLPLRIENILPPNLLNSYIDSCKRDRGGVVHWINAPPPLEPHLEQVAYEIEVRLLVQKMRLESQAETLDRPSRPMGVGAADRPSRPMGVGAADRQWDLPSPALPAARPAPPAPAPAPPPIPLGAPPPAPAPPRAMSAPPMPLGAAPPARSGGGLIRAFTGLFRRSEPAPPASSQAVHTPSAPPPAVPAVQPAQPAPAPPSPVTALSGPRVATPPATNTGEPRETPQARVDFSVYAPSSVQPGSSFLLNVWACLPGQRAEMVERATGPSRKVEAGSRGGILLPSETPLLLRLSLDGFSLDNPIEPFAWHGQVTNVSFLVSAPAQLAPGAYPGQVQLLDGGMLIGKFYFEVVVAVAQAAGATAPAKQAELRSEWMRSAFASYASPDREKVVQRVQGITAAGVNVYLDVASLRTGHEWEKQLFDAIESADVFYLFWSSFARVSKNVEREWRTALDKKGLAFIHPIPLEDPRLALPPDELRSLHFNDIYLAILKTSQSGDSPADGPS